MRIRSRRLPSWHCRPVHWADSLVEAGFIQPGVEFLGTPRGGQNLAEFVGRMPALCCSPFGKTAVVEVFWGFAVPTLAVALCVCVV
jgi:hypothetical protein